MVDAARPDLEPRPHVMLRDGDRPFFDDILRARARAEWDEHALGDAVRLARLEADIEREQRLLDAEGTVVENARGTPVANPRVAVLADMTRRQYAAVRVLRMGGTVAGEVRNLTGKRKTEREARATRAELEDEELMAT